MQLLGGKKVAKLPNEINEKDLFSIDYPDEYLEEWGKKKRLEFDRKKLIKLQEFYVNEKNSLKLKKNENK